MSPTLNDFFKQKTKIPRRTGTTLMAVPFRKPPCPHQGGGITCDVGDTKERGTFFFFSCLRLSRILGVVFYFHGSAPFSREGGKIVCPPQIRYLEHFWQGGRSKTSLATKHLPCPLLFHEDGSRQQPAPHSAIGTTWRPGSWYAGPPRTSARQGRPRAPWTAATPYRTTQRTRPMQAVQQPATAVHRHLDYT